MNAQNSFPTGVINLRMSNLYLGLPGGSVVKILPAIQEPKEVRFQSLGQEDPLEESMATHSSILA